MLQFPPKIKIVLASCCFATSIFAQQEIEITGGSNINIVDGATVSSISNGTNYGPFDISSGAKHNVFKIKNVGNQNLILGSTPVAFVSGSSATFAIVSQPTSNFVITPGSSTTFTVSFNPTAVVTTSATITVASNDSNENPFTFFIEGEGAQIYPDTDGDGLSDNKDIDDDNDGIRDSNEQILCTSTLNSSSVDVVFLNENFGTGLARARINNTTPGVSTSYCYEDGTTAMGIDECNTDPDLQDGKYTVHYSVGNGVAPLDRSNTGTDLASWEAVWYTGQDHTPGDTNGRMAVFNASYTPGVFYETIISGVIPSVPTNYSFWAINIDANDAAFGCSNCRILPNITVKFLSTDYTTVFATFNTGNISRCNSSSNTCPTSDWKYFSTSVNLTESQFIIQFVNNSPGGGGNDLALDDIVISQSLCDIDNDGVADVYDLDNDNDGIPNILEFSYTTNYDADRDATTMGAGWADANFNGMSDVFETLTPNDYDGDGVPNFMDLDSDNDSLFDSVEYDGFGDIDVNGDGTGDGNDTKTIPANDEFDGDGILGLLDNNDSDSDVSDHGNTSYSAALDTDSDGLPNYLDKNLSGINQIVGTIYASFDTNNDGIIDGTGDIDKDGILDVFDTNDNFFGSPRDINLKTALAFDGRNDYVEESGDIVLGKPNATLMAWVKLDSSIATEGIIVGQQNFFIRITSGLRAGVSVNGANYNLSGTIDNLPKNMWIHVAAVFNGATSSVKLYVNGEVKLTQSVTSSINTSTNKLFRIGSQPASTNTNYFKGEIDEVRVFDAALTDAQLQSIVYQELHATNFAQGKLIPHNVPGLSATSLIRYFLMDTFKNDIVDNLVTPTIDVSGAKLFNIKNIFWQTAPMPYETIANGSWTATSSWKNGSIWGIPDKPWKIVEINSEVTTTTNQETLGLIIKPSGKLNMAGDLELKNTWYIKLDGTIDLQNRSQLIQTQASILDVTSAGNLEREQNGIANLFNYNYWSSPVSNINNTTNNSGFSLNSVFKDATNPATLLNPNWVSGYFGSQTTPISIASAWLYKFQNLSDSYANWTSITPSSIIGTGQGYTMKGVANNFAGGLQKYAFVGKPNNGNITLPIAANNINLTGNPYPSSIDSRELIRDNILGGNAGTTASTDGTIYFWQHAPENNSHNLAAYKGGYATLNLVGGVPPMVAATGTSGLGSSSKIPNRHIPVGQGFFMKANSSGGVIQFKNSQRAFKLETDNSVTGSNEMIRSASTNTTEELYKKIRLNFETVNGFEKQILLGFMNNEATDDIDVGYDAVGFDTTPSDFCFKVSDKKIIIQGVGSFNENNNYALFVKTEMEGNVKFKVIAKENFDPNQAMYIYDNETNIYHEIQNQEAEINLPAGTFENRFSLRFLNSALHSDSNFIDNQSVVLFVDAEKNIIIKNTNLTLEIKNIELFNLLGQKLTEKKGNASEIILKNSSFATGAYIVKINHQNGSISKKIIIK